MLEKIGLPEKPAAQGSSWVIDASHCQACASQFTFFNRKHHCRRCGGLFCGNCTQQRAVLKGQGEGPVRICGPCKKLDDAARFESRYGQKHRTFKGGSKATSKTEVNLPVKQLLSSEDNPQKLSSSNLDVEDKHELYNSQDVECTSSEGTSECSSRKSMEMPSKNDEASCTPELLRQQALEEKRKWLTLKKDGKSEEAMLAFKRGRELERQAETLELSIRRSQRQARASASLAKRESKDDISTNRRKKKGATSVEEAQEGGPDSSMGKQSSGKEIDENYDVLKDLKELGWSDAELRDAGKKHAKNRSVENELAGLATETRHSNFANKDGMGISSMQVLAHKRKALALKREGKMAEAKEELKKAKIIERQLEEQELGGGEESDDELAALIQNLDKEKAAQSKNPMHVERAADSLFDFTKLPLILDEGGDDSVEVSDSDMNDPEMLAALRSMGWGEEAEALGKTSTVSDFDKLNAIPGVNIKIERDQAERGHAFVNSKKEVTTTRRLEEWGLEISDPSNDAVESVDVTEEDMEDPHFLSVLRAMGFEDEKPAKLMQPLIDAAHHSPVKKATLQQEILSLKKEALELKRAGQMDAAKEELRRAKQLEKELQDLQVQHKFEDNKLLVQNVMSDTYGFESNEEDTRVEVVDVTEEDLVDPEFAKTLKLLGWQDDESSLDDKKVTQQQEIISLKEEAVELKHARQIDAAKVKLNRAKQLEKELQDLQVQHMHDEDIHSVQKMNMMSDIYGLEPNKEDTRAEIVDVTEEDFVDPELAKTLKSLGWQDDDIGFKNDNDKKSIKAPSASVTSNNQSPKSNLSQKKKKSEIQRELLGLKRSALKLRREGRTEEAEQKLEKALVLEQQMAEFESNDLVLKTDIQKGMSKEQNGAEIQNLQPVLLDENQDKEKTNKEHMKNVNVLTGCQQTRSREQQERGHLSFDVLKNDEGSLEKNKLTKGTTCFKQSEEANFSVESMLVETGMEEQTSFTCRQEASRQIVSPGNFTSDLGERGLSIGTFLPLYPQYQAVNAKGGGIDFTTEGNGRMDLLTGGDWKPVGRIADSGNIDDSLELGPRDSLPSNGIGMASSSDKQVLKITGSTLIDELRENENALSQQDDTLLQQTRKKSTMRVNENILPIMVDKASVEHDLQQQILTHKRKALVLKREGRQVEAKEELRHAKVLEKKLELSMPVKTNSADSVISSVSVDVSAASLKYDTKVEGSSNVNIIPKKVSPDTAIGKSSSTSNKHVAKDRLKLQQESLAHKRKALALRREGKMDEAEIETQLAKSIEMQIEELEGVGTLSTSNDHQRHTLQDDGVDDILDPQLLAALKGLGWKDSDIFINNQVLKAGPEKSDLTGSSSNMHVGTYKPAPSHQKYNPKQTQKDEKSQLEEKIKAEKLRAVQLKHLGKRAEALEALRGAKALEKKLVSLTL